MKKFAIMLGNLTVIIGVYFLVIQSLFALWDAFVSGNASMKAIEDINFRVGIVVNDIVGLALYMVIFGWFYKKSIFAMSDMRRMSARTTGIITILSVCMGIWLMFLVRIPAIEREFPQFNDLFDFLLGKNVAIFIVFWIIHSFYKEIFFRGLIFNEMQRVFPTYLSIFFLGIIYNKLFFNWDPVLSAYGMLGAVILCLIYIWQKSIWSTILAEFVLFSTYFVIYLIDPPFGAWMVAVIIGISGPIIYLMYILWKTRVPAISKV